MFSRLTLTPTKPVQITLNGQSVIAQEGDTVAAALLCQGIKCTRTTAITNTPRGPFCLMGVCFECLMVIDGVANQRACMTRVHPGMCVETQLATGCTL